MSSLWQSISQFDKGKIQYGIAVRNSLAVAIPLAAGVALDQPAAGLITGIGALNVSYSDGADPYFYRARRMLVASALVAGAVFLGAATAGNVAFSVLLTAIFGFSAGMMVAVNQTAADIGSITLVTFIVFSAHAMPAADALRSAGAALAGGVLQTAFALALWPVRKHAPERRALAALYTELARAASSHAIATEAPPASQQSTEAQSELALLGGSTSVEAERYLALLSQAERIRLVLLALSRIRVRMSRESGGDEFLPQVVRSLDLVSHVLAAIARSLLAREPATVPGEILTELEKIAESMETNSADSDLRALLQNAAWQLQALAGQLRSAVELTDHSSSAGAAAFARREAETPWHLRVIGAFPMLRANLTLRSAAFRHALRLGVCVAAGEAAAHAVDWQRSYWLPMTVAIVLRPDFGGTFSRGLLRLLGTLIGLGFATALFHFLIPSLLVQVALIAVLTFVMRSYGRANYGILVMALSAMIVLLLAITGVAPEPVIAARGINTFAGGLLALAAYALWPTWERSLFPEAVAQLLDAYREYYGAIARSYLDPSTPAALELDATRLAARLARSNLEASLQRLRSEPGVTSSQLAVLDRLLANSHRFIHAAMALEAGLTRSQAAPARPAFRPFSQGVQRTLEALAAELRGHAPPPRDWPDLRKLQLQLMRSGSPKVERYEMVNIETDRITNSLNTLTEEIHRWRTE